MKISRQLIRAILCLAFALLAGGCTTATSALWDRQKDSPAERPLIRMSFDSQRKDILVCYNGRRNNDSGFVERYYWLFASTNVSVTHGAPVFDDNPDFEHLVGLPLFQSKIDMNHESPPGYCALAEPKSRKFELWEDGKKIGTYKLPEHSEWGQATAWRVALTPLAVTCDATLTVGAAAGVSIIATHGEILLLPLALAHR